MDSIDINNIKILEKNSKSVKFKDDKNEYSFLYSKNTLFKKFDLKNPLLEIPINIIEDPYTFLKEELLSRVTKLRKLEISSESVIIPLYSEKNGEKIVCEKSGLNLWNASGRKRDFNEVELRIRSNFYRKYPNFFPDKDTPFDVELPNGKTINMRVCQANGKAIMSNPNKAFGEWILRDVLQLKKGELLTYQKLKELGIDSIIFTKGKKYSINFIKNN